MTKDEQIRKLRSMLSDCLCEISECLETGKFMEGPEQPLKDFVEECWEFLARIPGPRR